MQNIGNLIKRSGFGTRESGVQESCKDQLSLEQARANTCEYCLKQGARGFVRIPGTICPDGTRDMETTIICERRHECQKLGQYFTDCVERNQKSSGMTPEMKSRTVNAFIATEPWQKTMRNLATSYIGEYRKSGSWLLMAGQSGCGKTHLCSAVCNKLLSDGRPVKYCDWLDLMRSVKAFDYQKLDQYRDAKYLFLDDLYKRIPSPEESKATMELINHRYRNSLPTIITSERTAPELLAIDEAVVGRIIEKCGRNWCVIDPSPDKNYRMKFKEQTGNRA